MMTGRLRLEDFGIEAPAVSIEPEVDFSQEIEAARKEAYEIGFKAGWDDAMTADAQEKSRISAELERSLLDLNVTYHEARSHVIGSLEPFLVQILEGFLPNLAQESFVHTVVETVQNCAQEVTNCSIELTICPSDRAVLEPLVAEHAVALIEDQNLTPSQAHLRFGAFEKQIDVAHVAQKISALVTQVSELDQETNDE